MGPSPEVSVLPRYEENTEDNTSYGLLVDDAPVLPSAEDLETVRIIKNLVKDAHTTKKCNEPVLNWPATSILPVSEYDNDNKIFAGAFPWLFPGGVGDFVDIRSTQISAADWAKRMIMYFDGRFVKDEMFCFFVLNYVVRRRNQSRGNFFINHFSSKKSIKNVDDIKDAIAQGNTCFLNEITYFTKEVVGSDGYWRMKRSQLHSWISHHIEFQNGRPDFFITLSCAEYWWPDIRRLVERRIEIATGNKPDLGDKTPVQLMNDWCSVVQEFFQQRVLDWMESVGKNIFGIEHYWIRYEFAPSRGQIHAHILAISNNKWIQNEMHVHRHDKKAQANILSEWASKHIGLTAIYNDSESEKNEDSESISPLSKYYSDTINTNEQNERDVCCLQEKVCMHTCSNGYCMRETNAKEKVEWCKMNNIDPSK